MCRRNLPEAVNLPVGGGGFLLGFGLHFPFHSAVCWMGGGGQGEKRAIENVPRHIPSERSLVRTMDVARFASDRRT